MSLNGTTRVCRAPVGRSAYWGSPAAQTAGPAGRLVTHRRHAQRQRAEAAEVPVLVGLRHLKGKSSSERQAVGETA